MTEKPASLPEGLVSYAGWTLLALITLVGCATLVWFAYPSWMLGVAGVAMVLLPPTTGLTVVALVLPFFGFAPETTHVVWLHMFVLGVIVSFGWRRLRRRSNAEVCSGPPSRSDASVTTAHVLAVGVAMVALVNLLSMVGSIGPWWYDWLDRLSVRRLLVPDSSLLFPLRVAFDTLLGVGLFLVVRSFTEERGIGAFRFPGIALAASLLFVTVYGVLRYFEIAVIPAFDYPIITHTGKVRLQSIFANPGWLAEYLSLVTPLVLAVTIGFGRRASIAGSGLLILTWTCLVLSLQRGGWLATSAGCIVTVVVWYVWTGSRQALSGGNDRPQSFRLSGVLLPGLLVVVFAGALLSPQVRSRVQASLPAESLDLSGRRGLWQAAVDMFEERPLSGVGMGTYQRTYDCFRPPDESELNRWIHGEAHSLYLQLLAETGVIGTTLFLLYWFLGVAGAVYAVRVSPDQREAVVGAGIVGSLVAFGVYGLVQHMFYVPAVAVLSHGLIGIGAGLGSRCVWRRSSGASASKRRVATMSIVVGVLLCLLIASKARQMEETCHLVSPPVGEQEIVRGIAETYWTVLDREPDPYGWRRYLNLIESGELRPKDVRLRLMTSAESLRLLREAEPDSLPTKGDLRRVYEIDRLYRSLLGRGADPLGLISFVQKLRAEQMTMSDVETAIRSSEEYQRKQEKASGGGD